MPKSKKQAKPKRKIPKEYAALLVLILFSIFIKLFKLTEGQIVRADVTLLPVIITAIIILLIYDIGYRLTRNMRAGLFSAALAAFIPISGLEQYSITAAMSILFFLFTLFLFSQVNKEKRWTIFLLVPLIFALMTDSSMFLVPLLTLFYVLIKILKYNMTDREAAYIAVTGVVILLIAAIADKNPFSLFQIAYINLIANYISLGKLVSIAGMFPIIFGFAGATLIAMQKEKSRFTLLMVSSLIALMVFLLISPLKFNFIFPAFFLVLSCLGAVAYSKTALYIRKSKLKKHVGKIMSLLFVIVLYFAVRHWLITG